MPCNGGNYFGRDRVVEVESKEATLTIDILTRRLCHACELLSTTDVGVPAELDEWWYEHKLKDQALIEEAKRRAALEEAEDRRGSYLNSVRDRVLGQLTPDEREALGL